MTRDEFAAIMAYLTAGCGKPLSEPALEVYFGLLCDLTPEAIQAAADKVLISWKFNTFPPVAVLREAAAEIVQQVDCQTALEAWGLVQRAIVKFSLDGEQQALASLPKQAAMTAKALGWRSLCDASSEELNFLRGQFLKAYETVAERTKREAALPNWLKTDLAKIGVMSGEQSEQKRLTRKELTNEQDQNSPPPQENPNA